MKNRKLILTLTSALLLALVFAMGMSTKDSYAASKKKKAMKAYRNVLTETEIDWAEEEDESKEYLEDLYFATAYIDKDSVPELILFAGDESGHGIYGAAILFTYKKNKLKRLENMGFVDGSKVGYYKKKGYIKDLVYDDIDHNCYEYTKLSGTKLKYCNVGTEYDYDNSQWRYNYKGKYCSKSSFKKKVRKMTGKKKMSKFKWHKNTAKNRKKYLK